MFPAAAEAKLEGSGEGIMGKKARLAGDVEKRVERKYV